MTNFHSKEWPRKVHSTVWYCDLGHEMPFEFDNEADWKTHMRDLSLHPSRLRPPTEAQLDALVDKKQQLALRDPFVCPFCEIKPSSIAILGDHGNPADMEKTLIAHIASHLKSLLLKALPGFECEATDTSKMSVNFERSSQNRLRNSNSPPQPVSGAEYVKDVSPTFDDYDNEDEYRSQILIRTPIVPVEPEYLVAQPGQDEIIDGTEVDRFFALVPNKEISFTWESVLPESWRWNKFYYEMPTMEDDELLQNLWLQNLYDIIFPKISQEKQPERLKIVLREALVHNAHNDQKRFIPRRQLEIKCDVIAVARELKDLFPDNDPISWVKRASQICHGQTRNTSPISRPCFKIFAILVLIGKAQFIDYFQRQSLCDDDLPFPAPQTLDRCGHVWRNRKIT